MKKQYIIPIFVPHLGCPNDCVFCNQKSISGQKNNITKEEVKKTVDYFLKNFSDGNVEKEIAFFGGSFTGIDEKIQNDLLEVANEYIKMGKIDSIRISTRPDYIDKQILKRLKKYNVKTIELGVQTSNNYILKRCKRGHTFEDVKKASKLIRKHGFVLGHQMMVGLPDSTKLDELNTAKDLAKLKPKIMRIYPVLIIKNTELQRMYERGEYEPLTIEQAVERSKELYYFFNKKKINVIRIGLQNTDIISDPKQEKSDVVAGPYHPAFRQLVESSIWYDEIVSQIKKFNTKVEKVRITANEANINNIIGHKKSNIIKLKDIYNVDVIVKPDEKMKKGKFKIDIEEFHKDFANVE